jgi:predicted enzyme involved in methoxymalonyl-ACP biosynthesis
LKKNVIGEYIMTPKNSMVKEFYSEAGFEKQNNNFIYKSGITKLKRAEWIEVDKND